MAQKREWRTSLCNPFGKAHKNVRKAKLRPVSKKVLDNFPDILPGEMICDTCRKQAVAETVISRSPSPDDLPSFLGTSDELYFPPPYMELDKARVPCCNRRDLTYKAKNSEQNIQRAEI